jgi:hypothetical protein
MKIGYRLPKAYLDLLRTQNGGYIRFSLPEMVHNTIAGIGPNFPSLTEHNFEDGQDYVSFPLKGLVPFDGDGHLECNRQRPSESRRCYCRIAVRYPPLRDYVK